MRDNFIGLFNNTVRECWDKPALSDYKKTTITYGELAARITELKLLWEKAGITGEAKIAINAKSSLNVATTFMAAVSQGKVAVQLFNGFTPADTLQLVNHSDSRILYTEKRQFSGMDFEKMPALVGAIDMNTGELLAERNGFGELYANSHALLEEAYPNGMKPEDFVCDLREPDSVVTIMYTSGSTGNPKGVMLTVCNFSANVYVIPHTIPYHRGDTYLSLLPYAHIFGLTCDVIIPLCVGQHMTVLGLPPIPANVKEALMDVRPHVFMGVPLIFIKFIEHILGTYMHNPGVASKLDDPVEGEIYCKMLRDVLYSAMGGNIELFATGGAPIPPEVDNLLVRQLKLPFITGYGMTELAPIISFGHPGKYIPKSCGEYCHEVIDVKIDSVDPQNIAGEVLIKGDCVFAGYYKNEKGTAETFTADGWFRTGDMGTVDENRNLFLVGRCKNMLLSSNGQNIYPEEIETELNLLPYVAESIVVQREARLVALIVVNQDAVANANLSAETLDAVMKTNVSNVNKKIPGYSQIADFELRYEPFAKTPKGSIRRFLYK